MWLPRDVFLCVGCSHQARGRFAVRQVVGGDVIAMSNSCPCSVPQAGVCCVMVEGLGAHRGRLAPCRLACGRLLY